MNTIRDIDLESLGCFNMRLENLKALLAITILNVGALKWWSEQGLHFRILICENRHQYAKIMKNMQK